MARSGENVAQLDKGQKGYIIIGVCYGVKRLTSDKSNIKSNVDCNIKSVFKDDVLHSNKNDSTLGAKSNNNCTVKKGEIIKRVYSKRNKTLFIEEVERERLLSKLQTADTLRLKGEYLNRVICGDVFSVLPLLPNEFCDLIIIDPPYNIDKDFGDMSFCKKSNEEYLKYINSWLHEVCKKLKSNGSLYLCGDWKSTAVMQMALENELFIKNRITWQREKGRGSKHNWKNCMEDIWFAVKNPNDYYFDVESVKVKRKVVAPYKENGTPKDWEEEKEGRYRLTYPSNFWDDITIPFWSMAENTSHPTQKSEKLYAKLILASCKKGGVVFDPFLGSGTAAVVAKKLGRVYCGVEINKEYCLYAQKRLDSASNDSTIQGYNDGVFWERNSTKAISRGKRTQGNLINEDDLFKAVL